MSLPLIDKSDSFEIVRNQIAAILAIETTNQQALAKAAEKDSDLWKLRIFTERSIPYEQLANPGADLSPSINVWFDNSNIDSDKSDYVKRQKMDGTYNIDCYAFGISSDEATGGHKAGDKEAALNVQRAIRLVRNILMSAEYSYLNLRGLVWSRWIQSITVFQPEIDKRPVPNVIAARIAFVVGYNEFSPQFEGETFEELAINVLRAETGEVYFDATYLYNQE